MKIREAAITDIDCLLTMGLEFYEYSKLGAFGLAWKTNGLATTLINMISDDNCVVLVAVDEDDNIMGTISGGLVPWYVDNTAMIAQELWFWVNPESRGNLKAIHKLSMYFSRWAQIKGAMAIVVAGFNSVGKPDKLENYYKRLGFTPLETQYIKRV